MDTLRSVKVPTYDQVLDQNIQNQNHNPGIPGRYDKSTVSLQNCHLQHFWLILVMELLVNNSIILVKVF